MLGPYVAQHPLSACLLALFLAFCLITVVLWIERWFR